MAADGNARLGGPWLSDDWFPKYYLLSIVLPLTVCFFYSVGDIYNSIRFKTIVAEYRISGLFGTELIQGSYFIRFLILYLGVYALVNNNFKNKFIYYSIFFVSILLLFFVKRINKTCKCFEGFCNQKTLFFLQDKKFLRLSQEISLLLKLKFTLRI